jgi:phosphatidylinositol alpha-mannosyltransferase
MKIGLFPLHTFAKPGGVKRHVLALHREFKKRGLHSKIVVPRRLRDERYGNDIILLGNSFEIPFYGTQGDFSFCPNPKEIEELLEREKFDILHFHNFGLHSLQILESSRAPAILTFHANIEGSTFFKAFPFLLSNFQKIVAMKIDGVICIAPFQLKLFQNFRGPKTVIPNGVDLTEFHPKVPPIKKFQNGKLNILFLGRVEERKGLIYLLKAYQLLKRKFTDIRLIVAGEGPLLPACKKFVETNKIPDVIFDSVPEEGDVANYYATSDIFVAPSLWGESFGMVLVEAMACGKPVIAFANEGYKGVLTGEGAEFLVPPKDWQGLAQKIEVLIKNRKKRNEMGKWGIREAKKYAWPKIADKVLHFYDEVLKTKKAKGHKQ